MTSTENSPTAANVWSKTDDVNNPMCYFNFDRSSITTAATSTSGNKINSKAFSPTSNAPSTTNAKVGQNSHEETFSTSAPPPNFQQFTQNLLKRRSAQLEHLQSLKQQQLPHQVPELKITLESSPSTPSVSSSSSNSFTLNSANSPDQFQFNKSPRVFTFQQGLTSSNKSLDTHDLNITAITSLEDFHSISQSSDPESDVVIVDLRPFNQYNISRLKNALSICIPSTLLKRNSFNLSNIFKTMIASQQEILESKLEDNTKKLKIIFYDSSSVVEQCSLQLHQIIKKFEAKLNDYNKPIDLFFINHGFNSFDKNDSSLVDCKKFKPDKSPDQAAFSEFLLPSADPTSSFLMALKCNQLNTSSDLLKDVTLNVPSILSTGANQDNLPNWIRPFSDPNSIESIVSNFVKIENIENQRISASVQRKLSMSAPKASPNSPNSGYQLFNGSECGFKNRYPNILPYEHSRVKLVASPMTSAGTPGSANNAINYFFSNITTPPAPPPPSAVDTTPPVKRKNSTAPNIDDYFNANFINVPQINENYHYIATQAPLPSTIDDFWKVVWYNGVEIIVSLTNLNEYGLKKSDVYWENSSNVKLISETNNFEGFDNDLIVRKIEVTKRGKTKIITQLNFLSWPDHGVVNHAKLLRLLQVKQDFVANKEAPILVHCSAGCGRTGTFITIDVIVNTFKDFFKGDLKGLGLDLWKTDTDLINFTVQQLRKQRISMVQSLNQFILCYETVLNYFAQHIQDTVRSI